MTSSLGRLAGLSIACVLIWTLAAAAAHAQPPAAPADQPTPTPIEEALLEHACGAMHPPGTVETDAYLTCRANRLVFLRAEFGRDLRRLSSAERSKIDSACSELRATQGQDAYVRCLAAQLASLRKRGGAAPEPAGAPAAQAAVAPAAAAPPAEASPRFSAVWIGAGIAALVAVAAGGAAFVKLRATPAFGSCRTCGAPLLERGDLCHACRHEAADALRRASTERSDQERKEQEAQRRLTAHESDQQQRAREDETRRRELEAAQAAQARQQEEEAQRRRDEEARQQRQTDAAAAQGEFDPHAVLGVPPEASAAEIETAYQAARTKYDPDLVSGMGVDLQEHFKRKGEAVQRAYEMLTRSQT